MKFIPMKTLRGVSVYSNSYFEIHTLIVIYQLRAHAHSFILDDKRLGKKMNGNFLSLPCLRSQIDVIDWKALAIACR